MYLKKWTKTKHAYLFKLSNKVVQVDFSDKTEIILSRYDKNYDAQNKEKELNGRIYYVGKNSRGEYKIDPKQGIKSFEMAFDTENDIEMVKRLKYTKELLAAL